MGFIYLPLGHDFGAMVGGVFQTQLTNGADEGPMSMLAVVARHMLGVCGLAHLRRNDQQYSLRTPLWPVSYTHLTLPTICSV